MQVICPNCNYLGKPTMGWLRLVAWTVLYALFIVSIFLWPLLPAVIVWFIYLLKHKGATVCPVCGLKNPEPVAAQDRDFEYSSRQAGEDKTLEGEIPKHRTSPALRISLITVASLALVIVAFLVAGPKGEHSSPTKKVKEESIPPLKGIKTTGKTEEKESIPPVDNIKTVKTTEKAKQEAIPPAKEIKTTGKTEEGESILPVENVKAAKTEEKGESAEPVENIGAAANSGFDNVAGELNKQKNEQEIENQKRKTEFEAEKPVIVARLESLISNGNYSGAFEEALKYDEFNDESIISLMNKAEEADTYQKVRKIPASEIRLNRAMYKRLTELAPENETYRMKFLRYDNEVSEQEKDLAKDFSSHLEIVEKSWTKKSSNISEWVLRVKNTSKYAAYKDIKFRTLYFTMSGEQIDHGRKNHLEHITIAPGETVRIVFTEYVHSQCMKSVISIDGASRIH